MIDHAPPVPLRCTVAKDSLLRRNGCLAHAEEKTDWTMWTCESAILLAPCRCVRLQESGATDEDGPRGKRFFREFPDFSSRVGTRRQGSCYAHSYRLPAELSIRSHALDDAIMQAHTRFHLPYSNWPRRDSRERIIGRARAYARLIGLLLHPSDHLIRLILDRGLLSLGESKPSGIQGSINSRHY